MKYILRKLEFVVLFLVGASSLISTSAFGGTTPFHARLRSTLGVPIITNLYYNNFISAQAPIALLNKFDASLKTIITLGYIADPDTVRTSSVTYMVRVEITPHDIAGVSQIPITKDLEVISNPAPGVVERNSQYIILQNVYSVDIKIISISNGSTLSSLPIELFLDADMTVERYYEFTGTQVAFNPIILNDQDCDGIMDEAIINWSMLTGAEEYQLEWSFINDYSDANNVAPILTYDFKNNSTRITTSIDRYNIPLIFDHGYLIYRVRAIGRNYLSPSIIISGVWDISADAGLVNSLPSGNKYLYIGEFHKKKNWQLSSTFAEEAKSKRILTFADGSLRSRQVVTKLNSDSTVLVGESIYDFQGRKAVDILPVPSYIGCVPGRTGKKLTYFNNFNKSNSSHIKFSRDDFDKDTLSPCHPVLNSLDSSSGAANYYSPFNPVKTSYQGLVPDAHGFPFTQMEYTPDNTGRVRRQGGVGEKFQLGSNHEVVSVYGQPNQIQLDRLFGSEAGDAAHYKKNIVIDANGQESISYMNLAGKTVATSLAGDNRDRFGNILFDSLNSAGGAVKDFNIDLFSKDANGLSNLNTVNVSKDGIEFSSPLTVGFKSDYSFNYSIRVKEFRDSCLKNGICFNCVYDMDIQIRNDCGQLITDTAHPSSPVYIHKKIGKLQYNGDTIIYLRTCDSLIDLENFVVNLDPGNYMITKSLLIDKSARDFYVHQYLDSNKCFFPLDTFINRELRGLDTTSCYITCESCKAGLGTKEEFVSSGRGSDLEYDYLYEECGKPCDPISPCDASFEQMCMDVSPGGQYGEFIFENKQNPGHFPLSVYNSNNYLSGNIVSRIGFWKHPLVNVNGIDYPFYIEEDGSRSIVILEKIDNTNYIPVVDDLQLVFYNPDKGYYTYPENLANLSDFIPLFISNWSKSLVSYHPEYCYYKVCHQMAVKHGNDLFTSDEFDEKMYNADTYSKAVASGLLNNAGVSPATRVVDYFYSSPIHLSDPFVANNYFQTYAVVLPFNIKLSLKNKFDNYLKIDGTWRSMAMCAAMMVRCSGYRPPNQVNANCYDFGGDYYANNVLNYSQKNDSIRNREWTTFRRLYLTEKQKILKQVQELYAKNNCRGINGCIGEKSFNPYFSGLINFIPWWAPHFNILEPCSYLTYRYYSEKQRRFPDENDIPVKDANNANYQLYLSTGQCPLAVQFQYFLSALASKRVLTAVTPISLFDIPEFTLEMYDYLLAPQKIQVVLISTWVSTGSINDLTGKIRITTNTGVKECNVVLSKNGNVFLWDDVMSFQQVKYVSDNNGLYNFNATGIIPRQATNATAAYNETVKVTGTTCIKLGPCEFKDECKPNQLAIDLEILLSGMASNQKLTSPVINPFDFTNSYLNNLLSPTILNALSSPDKNIKWYYDNVANNITLVNPNFPNKKLIIDFLSFQPGSFSTQLNTLFLFKGMSRASQYLNTFTINGFDASNNQVVTIEGKVRYVDLAANTEIIYSLGKCGLPTPINCIGNNFERRSELETLLRDVFVRKPFNANINIAKSPYFSSLLQGVLPASFTGTTGTLSSIPQVNGDLIEKLTIAFQPVLLTDCEMVLTLVDKVGSPIIRFSELVDLNNLTATPPSDFQQNDLGFYFIGTFNYNGTLYKDTIRGESCFPIRNCKVCDKDTILPDFSGRIISSINSGKEYSESDVEISKRNSVNNESHFVIPQYLDYKSGLKRLNDKLDINNKSSWKLDPISVKEFYAISKNKDIYKYIDYCNSSNIENAPSNINLFYETKEKNENGLTDDEVNFKDGNVEMEKTQLSNTVDTENESIKSYKQYIQAFQNVFSKQSNSKSSASVLAPLLTYHQFLNLDNRRENLNIHDWEDKMELGMVFKENFNSSRNLVNSSFNQIDTCTDNYSNLLYTVTLYNTSTYALAHNHYLSFGLSMTYGTYLSDGYCNCSSVYISYLNNYISAGLTTNLSPVLPVPIMNYESCSAPFYYGDTCHVLYRKYLIAYHNYVVRQQSTPNCPNFQLSNPVLSYAGFLGKNWCCSSDGINYIYKYIGKLNNLSTCLPINNLTLCNSTVPDSRCDTLYTKYLLYLAKYNNSPYALAHNHTLDINLVPTLADFVNLSHCDCVENYLKYLSDYFLLSANSPSFLPVSIENYSGCKNKNEQNDSLCLKNYKDYLLKYSDFALGQQINGTCNFQTASPLYSYQQFVDGNLCCSDTGFILFRNYSNSFLNTTPCPGVMPNLTVNCSGQVDSSICNKAYQSYLLNIAKYNISAYAIQNNYFLDPILFSSSKIFKGLGYCDCIDAYLRYLNGYNVASANANLPMPVPINQFTECNKVNSDNCLALYNQLNAAIFAYNFSPYEVNMVKIEYPFKDYESFLASGYCKCVSAYITYLKGIISIPFGKPAVNLLRYNKCDSTVIRHGDCEFAYQNYIQGISDFNNYLVTHPSANNPPVIVSNQSADKFTFTGFCYCVPRYTAFLKSVTTEMLPKSIILSPYQLTQLNISTFCAGPPHCEDTLPDLLFIDSAIVIKPDSSPCVKELVRIATQNAYIKYSRQLDSLTADIARRYTEHCLNALENFNCKYKDKEYHFTLYYYDQAGNLVKTIPPEGVELLNITSYTDPLEQKIIADRTNGVHTNYTNHLMATVYDYNSLNQLVHQCLPDQDKMDIWEYTLPNGLDSRLFITSTQFVNPNKGYLTGYVTVSANLNRGYLYTTDDAGSTWRLLYDLAAADFNKVQMVTSLVGYAVGNDGVIVKTSDGGVNWDLINTYAPPVLLTANLNDLSIRMVGSNYKGYIVGESGTVFQIDDIAGVITFTKLSYPAGIVASTISLTSITSDAANVYYVAGSKTSGEGAIFRINGLSLIPLTWYATTGLNKISFFSATNGFAAGIDGNLIKTNVSGDLWSQVPTGITHDFLDIYFRNANVGIALIDSAPDYNQIYKTGNGGRTWELLSKPGEYFNAMHFSSDKRGIIVGKNGLIRRVISFTGGAAGVLGDPPYFGTINVVPPLGTSTMEWKTVTSTTISVSGVDKIFVTLSGTDAKVYTTSDIEANPVVWRVLNSGLTAADYPLKKVAQQIVPTPLINPVNYLVYLAFIDKQNQPYCYAEKVSAGIVTGSFVRPPNNNPTYLYDLSVYNNTSIYTVGKYNSFSPDQFVHKITIGTNVNGATATFATSSLALTGIITTTSICVPPGGTKFNVVAKGNAVNNGSTILNGTIGNYPVKDRTWAVNPLPFLDIQSYGTAGNFMATQVDGNVMVSEVSGTKYRTYITRSTDSLNAIRYDLSASKGVIAANAGKLFGINIIQPCTLNLSSISTGVTESFNDIAFTSAAVNCYISGNKGRVIQLSSLLSNPLAKIANPSPSQINFRGIALSANDDVIAVGSHSSIYHYIGTSGTHIKEVFVSSLRDANFRNADEGFVIGANGIIRQTVDGGLNWKLIRPEYFSVGANTYLPTYNTVWNTNSNQGLIGGSNNYLTKINSNGSLAFIQHGYITNNTTSWNDIKFGNDKKTGYIVGSGGNGMKLIYNPANSSVSTSSLVIPAGVTTFNALHIFRDNNFIAVGPSGTVRYYNGTSYVNQNTGISNSAILNDVYFHDDRTGYVVGNGGLIYKCKSVCNINFPSTLSWTLKSVYDEAIVTNANSSSANIKVVAFPDRYNGWIGGDYSNTMATTAVNGNYYPYGRLLNDKSDYFSTRFWYDKAGRMILSQNAKQYNKSPKAFSYTLYDALGRITEVGEKAENSMGNPLMSSIFGDEVGNYFNPRVINNINLRTWIDNSNGGRTEVTRTYYDKSKFAIAPYNYNTMAYVVSAQENLRNRVSSVTYADTYNTDSTLYDHATHYSYDIHGNVKTLFQDNRKQTIDIGHQPEQIKRIDYTYDLISGKVNTITAQSSQPDQFMHRYSYDDDNRIRDVYTSSNGYVWDHDARYLYYAHGPLARVEYGTNQVQGLDYAYTLQGWIKGVNSNLLTCSTDMGRDGDRDMANNLNRYFAKDAFGYTLNYFQGDYEPIDASRMIDANRFESTTAGSDVMAQRNDLFNGNITMMATSIEAPAATINSQPSPLPQSNAYRYDQLNRIINTRSFTNIDGINNKWSAGSVYANSYFNHFSYDANGNIESQSRYDQAGTVIDNFTYNYNKLTPCGAALPRKWRNQLASVTNVLNTTTTMSYLYDELGNLKSDASENINSISWSVSGKMRKVERTPASSAKELRYDYDAMGNRISKKIYNTTGSSLESSTYYLRDAQGTVLSTYEFIPSPASYKLKERIIYGSSRVGMNTEELEMIGATVPAANSVFSHYLGNRGYECTNHLGNVLSVVSDRQTALKIISSFPNFFTSGVDGWVGSTNSFLANNAGRLQVTTSVQYSAAERFIPTIIGHKYQVVLTTDLGTASSLALQVYSAAYATQLVSRFVNTGTYTIYFTATTTTSIIRYINYSAPGANVVYYADDAAVYDESACFAADVKSADDYYAFGVPMSSRTFISSNIYRYGFNGHEKVDEISGAGNEVDMGGRYLDTRLGRTSSMDAKAGKYPFISPYAYAINNPINATDPDGKDVYLVVWKSKDGETGHAAIAVDNYKQVQTKVIEKGKTVTKTEWVKDGTATIYDLWPEKPVGKTELQDNVTDDYNKRTVNVADLTKKDVSVSGEVGKVSEGGEGRAGDGVVQITSDYATDTKVKAKLDAIQKSGADYNACTNNCSTFAQKGLQVLDPKTDASQTVKPTGALGLLYNEAKVVAPNNLFNAAAKMKGATVLKGPKQMEAKPYLKYFGK